MKISGQNMKISGKIKLYSELSLILIYIWYVKIKSHEKHCISCNIPVSVLRTCHVGEQNIQCTFRSIRKHCTCNHTGQHGIYVVCNKGRPMQVQRQGIYKLRQFLRIRQQQSAEYRDYPPA